MDPHEIKVEGVKRKDRLKQYEKMQEHLDELDKEGSKNVEGKMGGGKVVKKIADSPASKIQHFFQK